LFVQCALIGMHGERPMPKNAKKSTSAGASKTDADSKDNAGACFQLTRSEIESLRRGKQRIAEYALKEFQGWKDAAHERPASG
jgi:hypothetical protein